MDKIIHQFWNSADVPQLYDSYRETWKSCNSGWEYKMWSEQEVKKEFSGNRLYDTLCGDNIAPIHRWDIARIFIVHKFGGVYSDVDTICLQPIAGMIHNQCTFLFLPVECKRPHLHHFFFYADRGSPFLSYILKHIGKYNQGYRLGPRQDLNKYSKVNNSSGPIALTSLYHCYTDKSAVGLVDATTTDMYIHHHNHKTWQVL